MYFLKYFKDIQYLSNGSFSLSLRFITDLYLDKLSALEIFLGLQSSMASKRSKFLFESRDEISATSFEVSSIIAGALPTSSQVCAITFKVKKNTNNDFMNFPLFKLSAVSLS